MTSIAIIAVIICAAVATRSNVHNEIAIKLEPGMMINAGKKQKMLMLTLTISIRVSSLHSTPAVLQTQVQTQPFPKRFGSTSRTCEA